MEHLQRSERWGKNSIFHIPKKYEDEIKTFASKQKPTKCVAYSPALQEMPKDVVRLKRKDIRLKFGFIEKNIRKDKKLGKYFSQNNFLKTQLTF